MKHALMDSTIVATKPLHAKTSSNILSMMHQNSKFKHMGLLSIFGGAIHNPIPIQSNDLTHD
jgi:hypothetical protein